MYMIPDTPPLQIDHLVGKAKQRVYRVGIELEGGWKSLPPDVVLARDGSVSFPTEARIPDAPLKPMQLMTGELQSEPLEPKLVPGWVKKFYPHKVNETCGLHVHMSFKSMRHYQLLMDTPAYQAAILTHVRKWAEVEGLPPEHPVWDRLTGHAEFCKLEFFPDAQTVACKKDYDKYRYGNRYTIINYCWSMNSTIECRLLPMMETAAQAVRAIQKVIDVTNASLLALKKREEKVSGQIMIDLGDGTDVEAREEYV